MQMVQGSEKNGEHAECGYAMSLVAQEAQSRGGSPHRCLVQRSSRLTAPGVLRCRSQDGQGPRPL